MNDRPVCVVVLDELNHCIKLLHVCQISSKLGNYWHTFLIVIFRFFQTV